MRLMSWVNSIKYALESEGATVFFRHTVQLKGNRMAVQMSYDDTDGNSYDHIYYVSDKGIEDVGRTLR